MAVRKNVPDLGLLLGNPLRVLEQVFKKSLGEEYDAFKGENRFIAEVIKVNQNPPSLQIRQLNKNTIDTDAVYSPQGLLTNPCTLATATNTEFTLLMDACHPTAYPNASTEQDKLLPGDLVMCSSTNNVYGKGQQFVEYIKKIVNVEQSVKEKIQSSRCTGSSMEDFEDGSATARPASPASGGSTGTSTYSAGLPMAANALEFVQKLRKHFPVGQYSDNFLAGLAANAYYESKFKEAAAGDPGNCIRGNCSYGLWQFNLRSGNPGDLYLKHWAADPTANIDADSDEQTKIDFLIDGERQMKWMAEVHLPTKSWAAAAADDSISAKYWGQTIAVQFEGCAWCKPVGITKLVSVGKRTDPTDYETIIRGEYAEKIASDF